MRKRCVFLSLAMVAVILCLSLMAIPASANYGISLTPFESIKADVTPGETLTHQMKLTLGKQDQAIDIAVDVMGFGSSLDGSPQAIEAVQDTSPYSARSFISVDKRSFHLEPGESQDIIATIAVPANVGEGGRYAIIYIHQQQPGGGVGAGSLSAFNIPVLLTISGSTLVRTGKITEITAGKALSGQPVDIFTKFQNTGNYHLKFKGEVTISDSQGKALDTIYTTLTPSSIIPGGTVKLTTTFTPKGELPLGVYSVNSKVMLEDDTVLDQASGNFNMLAPVSAPPSAPASAPAPATVLTPPPAPPLPPPAPVKSSISWLVIGGGAAAILIIALLIFLLVRKRAY